MPTSNENKLSEESAKKELQRLFDHYELEEDDTEKQFQEVLKTVEKVLVKGVQKGFLSFEESEEKGFTIVQKLRNDDTICYKELDGQAKVIMEKKNMDHTSARAYELLGNLSGQGSSMIAKLKGPDLKRAEAIGAILLLM